MLYFRGMIKYLFILINSLCLFLWSLFNGDPVTVSASFPAIMTAGQEVSIELKVNKGAMNGFARLQLDLPEGITIKQSEDKGSEYSYDNNIAKWVWAAQPEDNEIVIKLTVQASETTSGAKTINARFSYVEDNNKQVVEMEPLTVSVVGPNANAADTSRHNMPMATSNSEPPGKISAERSITKISDTEYHVTLKIKKGITRGFAKYSDNAFDQVIVKALKTDGSSFSIADGKIKFVWVNVHEKDELEISYAMTGNFNKEVTLEGEYSYLENNQSKKYTLSPEKLSPATAQKEEKPETNLPAVTKENTSVTETKQEEKKQEPAESLSTDVPAPTVKPNTSDKTNFAIQIGAFTNPNVSASFLKQRFKIADNIRSEMQGGYSKFVVGSHAEYRDARYHKEAIKDINGIKSAFVVAYAGGRRITVQEALMATNQKWFK